MESSVTSTDEFPIPDWVKQLYWDVANRERITRRRMRTIIDRARYGVGVEDTFSFDRYIAGVIAEGVRSIRERSIGYPHELTESEWDEILAEMEHGFRRWADKDSFGDEEARLPEVKRSLKLFKRHFEDLWD